MTAEAGILRGPSTIIVRDVALVTGQSRHRRVCRKTGARRFFVTGQAIRSLRNELFLLFPRERMARQARDLGAHAVKPPPLVTAFAGVFIRSKGMDRPAVTGAAVQFPRKNMPCMPD